MFQLHQHVGIGSLGTEVEVKQWRIFWGSTLVGYLPQTQTAQIQALFHFPHQALTSDVLLEMAMQTADKLGVESCEVLPPEQHSKRFVEQAMEIKAKEEAEDDDE
jgi:hypothetical protein